MTRCRLDAHLITLSSVIRPKLPQAVVVGPEKVTATREGLPGRRAVVTDAVEVFLVRASPVRLRIMHTLAHDEMSVDDLARTSDVSDLRAASRYRVVTQRGDARTMSSRTTPRTDRHSHPRRRLRRGRQEGREEPSPHDNPPTNRAQARVWWLRDQTRLIGSARRGLTCLAHRRPPLRGDHQDRRCVGDSFNSAFRGQV
jgi:hypothetical protein